MEKRLTTARQWCEAKNDLENEFGYSHIWCRLNAIENILGDNYDLRHLRDLVQAEMEGRAPVAQARWTNHCCTACGKQAVTCTFSDGSTVYIETPRCPSCGARRNEVEP